MDETIRIRGAREHNLKNIDITLPRNKLIVITGLSGSGKSSLAFDTIFAEGQRRYVESLSSYARQFLGQMNKPDADSIEGLSPAISIDQKTTSHNPRSTVGTVTEIHDYLRLLYARIGVPHCPECGKEIKQQSIDQMVDRVKEIPINSRIQILSPVVRSRKGEYAKLFEDIRKQGYVRVRVDGNLYEIDDIPKLNKQTKHSIEVVVDRLRIREDMDRRLTESLESAVRLSNGLAIVLDENGEETLFSQNYACPDCGISLEELAPRMFSFNSPFGACPSCTGLGYLQKMDPSLIVPNPSLSLNEGAIHVTGWNSSVNGTDMARMYLEAMAEHYDFSLDTPFKDLPEKVVNAILYGTGAEKLQIHYERSYGNGTFNAPFEGIIPNLERRYRENKSDKVKEGLEEYVSMIPCPDCHGQRLKKSALAVTIQGLSIMELSDMPIQEGLNFLKKISLSPSQEIIAAPILKEVESRLQFLINVGLDYLTLSRSAITLSGGEAQRIRLATQIGSSLVGVMYILDEPSIGLHQKDNAKLLDTLKKLRDIGNSVIVVEHDDETMRAADMIVDIGPGAGEKGGQLVAQGTVEDLIHSPASITGKYLSGEWFIPIPSTRRTPHGWLTVTGARVNNLKNITVRFPLGVITCVTGVSGSGKSSLVNEILYKQLAKTLNRALKKPGAFDTMEGIEQLDKVIQIDQSPIGRTPRSNPATYTGVFELIRDVFAQTKDAKSRGYQANRFSFNVKGGRCETCGGDGIVKIEMNFLPDVYVPCEVCKGHRYNRETLEVKYKGKSIYDVLEMTVDEAVVFFDAFPRIVSKIRTLKDVGLGYVKLGQPSTTLSGGEAQRIKLATELSRKATGRTLYILDEPTTGLHVDDVNRLNQILQQLAEGGNTLVIIEHNLDVIKTADYIIDMGPEGGNKGGKVVVSGTPEEVARNKKSYTGMYLKKILSPDK